MNQESSNRRVLIVGIDGMRPDMFDPQVMPALASLVQSGVRASEYHSIYPTHTRAINTSLATGCTPGKHGWVANVYRYEHVTEDGIINTADVDHIRAMDDATAMNAIQVPTLGDLLARHGQRMGVASTQSSGASLIWTRKQPYPVATVSTTYGRKDAQAIWDRIGAPPEIDPVKPNKNPLSHWAKQAVIDIYLDDPDVSVIYFYMVEPDFSLHYYGLGSPEATQALRECDRALAQILDAMNTRGIRDQFDIIVLSDHGHSTTRASRTLTEHLERARRNVGSGFPELAIASDFIYALDGANPPGSEELAPLVDWIQDQPWAGAVFAAPEYQGLPGVLPLTTLWNDVNSSRAPLLTVNPAWSDEPNENGVPGMLAALTENVALRSTHGSCSPYEMHAFWCASGPSFLESRTTDVPAGATDLLPTVLALLGHSTPGWIDGRVMSEAFRVPAGEPEDVIDEEIVPEVPHGAGIRPVLKRHRVGKSTYTHHVLNGRTDTA